MTDRELVNKWWSEAWTDGLWAASWTRSLDALTPAQAAWSPAPGRHSVWQVVLHMIFWRESWLRRVATGQKPTPDEIARANFPAIEHATEEAWARDRARFAATQDRLDAALRDPGTDISVLAYFVPHDAYHFGQINYLRAMLGLAPIE